jgi:alkylhydroperoxidase family enzyme
MPPGSDGEPPLGLFRTLARHSALAERMRPLGAALLAHGQLHARDRELAILRTSARCGAEYEWGVHAGGFAAAAGLDEATVVATAAVAPAQVSGMFTGDDAAVVTLADELHDRAAPGDATWARLAARLDETQLLELLVVCGFYHAIAYVITGARVPREPWARRLPAGG